MSVIKQSLRCPPTYLLPNGSRTERMTGGITEVLVLPAVRVLASQHVRPVRWQKFTCSLAFFLEPTVTAIWGAISCDESGGSPWFLSWGLLIRVFLQGGWGGGGVKYWGSELLLCNQSLARISSERRSWAFPVTVTWQDIWSYSVIFKRKFPNWLSTDRSTHHFPANEGACAVFGNALEFFKTFFIRGCGFELNIDVKRPRNKLWRAVYSTCNAQFWLAFCWVSLKPNRAARVQSIFSLIHAGYFTANPPNSPVYSHCDRF